MKDVFQQFDEWRRTNTSLAVTTVIETWGSAPRPVGSKMIVTQAGGIAGSVSAGCVEGAVIEESQQVMRTGIPRVVEFGVADDTAWSVGLACGGKIKVFIEPGSAYDSIYDALKINLEHGKPYLTLTYLNGPDNYINKKVLIESDGKQVGNLNFIGQENQIIQDALSFLDKEKGGTLITKDGSILFVDIQPVPPKLIVVGAVHLALPLIKMASILGFETFLVDPRQAFATRERFPDVDKLIVEWPDEALPEIGLDKSTYVVVLTHDPKLDDPALVCALSSGAGYIGALGSRRTNQKRIGRLLKAGLRDSQLARLHAPIGLDLGGRSSDEIAISIMAEIVKVRNQGE